MSQQQLVGSLQLLQEGQPGFVSKSREVQTDVSVEVQGRADLLEGADEGLKLPRGVLHEQKSGQNAVQRGAIAGVGRIVQEWKLAGSMVLQHEADGIQLQQ